jgi:hypothetical protein
MKRNHKLLPAFAGFMTLAATAINAQGALIAHYTLDETSGTTTADSSGNALNGTVSGGAIGAVGAIQSTTGISGNAYSFSGTTAQRVDADFAKWGDLNLNPGYTVSLWLKWTVPGANNRSVAVSLAADGGGVNDRYADLGVGTSTGANVNADGSGYARHRGTLTTVDTDPLKADDPPNGGFDDGTWHLLTGVFTNTGVTVYFDGNQVDSATGNGGDIAFDALTLGLLQRPGGQTDVDPFEGAIDDVQIYDQALTLSEIGTLFANPGQTIPEPSSTALLGLGGLALVLRRRR